MLMLPSLSAQVADCEVAAMAVGPAISPSVNDFTNVQPFASFTVMAYRPATNALKVPEVWKFTPSLLYI